MQPKQLAGSGAVLGATSIVINDFTDIDGNNLTMSDFGAKGWMTLEPGSYAQEEQISFTGITVNGNGTSTLTGVKSVLFKAPYTETAGLAKSHAGGTTAVVSNTAGFYADFANLSDDETIIGIWTFTSTACPRMDASVTYGAGTELYLATKEYVDSVAFAGAPNASTTQKGISQEATLAQINAGTQVGSTGAELFVNPSFLASSIYNLQLPSASQKLALAGASGAVGSLNLYETQDDVTVDGTGLTQASQNATQAVGEANATTKANKIAQTFVAANSSLTAVKLHKLADTGSFTGTVTVELYAVDGSNNPTGAALATVTTSNAAWLALSTGLNTFTFGTPYSATIGTTYAIQVTTSTSDNSNHPNLGYQNTDVYPSGTLKRNNTTDGWVSITGDLTFTMLGTTASKVVRRSSSSQVTVPTTPVATTDAASKAYVDLNTSLNFVGVGSATQNKSYYSYVLPIFAVAATTDVVWTPQNLSSVKYQGNYGFNWTATTANNDMAFTANVYNAVGTTMTFGTKAVTTEFSLIVNSVGTDDMTWGLGENASAFTNSYNSAVNKTISFTVDKTTSKLYAHTSNGGGGTDHTEVEITGITLTVANTYRIEYINGVSATFYVNGVLKATITTTLPTSANILVGWGSKYHGAGSITTYPTAISAPNMLIQK